MHLSDIKHYERCPRLFWLCLHEPKPFVPFVYYNGSMSDYIREYFAITDCFQGQAGDDGQLAMQAIKETAVLINARFEYQNLRVKVSLMMKACDQWDVYFAYASCYPRDNEAQKIADTICVLEALGIAIRDVKVIHLNADYVRGETLNVKEMLVVTEYLYHRRNKAAETVLSLVNQVRRNVFAPLKEMHGLWEGDVPAASEGSHCMKGGKCRYYDDCFPNPTSDTCITNLMQTAHKYNMMEQGIHDMKDVDMALLEGTRQQYAQLMAARHNGFYMDRFALSSWMDDQLHYPLSYLDFEWETFVYPPYKGMRSYDVLVFQYSLHVESNQDAPLIHHEYIGQGDCRIAFIEHLIQHIPATGTILVFNMEGAEKLRLRQLAEQFPSYHDALMSLCDRMVDLSLPFASGCIYDSRMRGFYSLKKLAEIFGGLDYHALDISQGLQAAHGWRMMEDDEEAAETIRMALLKYCAMDTYAEYVLLHRMMKLVKQA